MCSFPKSRFSDEDLWLYIDISDVEGVEETWSAWKVVLKRTSKWNIPPELKNKGVKITPVKNKDWAEVFRKNLKPVRLTSKCMVVPRSREFKSSGRIVIRMDPGMAFGTGHHASTKLAAGMLEKVLLKVSKHVRQNLKILDVGSGTGILSIFAAKMGAGLVRAIDIDENARKASRKNVSINRVGQRVKVSDLAIEEIKGMYDIVVANLISSIILEIFPHFCRVTGSGGRLILSGLLKKEVSEIIDRALAHGFFLEQVKSSGSWAAVSFVKFKC